MPMTRSRAAIRGEADDHAGLGRAGDDADDDVVEPKPELRLLRAHLLGEADIAEAAKFVHRGAGRDGVGLAALASLTDWIASSQLLRMPISKPSSTSAAVGAHDAGQQDIADAVIDGVLVRHPAFLHETHFIPILAATAATMRVWLDCTPPIETSVSAFERDGVGHDIFQLAQLVAAERQAGIAVVALGVDLHLAAERRGHARQVLDRRGAEGQLVALELVQAQHCALRHPCRSYLSRNGPSERCFQISAADATWRSHLVLVNA